MQNSQNSKPRTFGNRERSTAKYVPRGPNRSTGRNQKPYMASIRTYADLQNAWRSELIRNPNASVKKFIAEKRVENFFKQEGTDTQIKFTNNADGMKTEIAHHRRECEKTAR